MDLSARFLSLALGGAGWVLWLLVALSVISLAISLERLWYFRTHRVQKATLLADMQVLLRERALDRPDDETLTAPRDDLAAAAEGAKAREKLRLERNLAFLATLGSNAPFVGLFGTVLGIIKAFHDLAANQAGGPSVVMAGISEALVATAVGLMVAIPAVVAFNYFNRRVRAFMCKIEWAAHLAPRRPEGRVERRTPRGRARAHALMGASTQGDSDDGSIAAINVTPMVDLTLVLLIIFMVAAPLLSSASSIKVNLPKAATAETIAVVAAVADAGAASRRASRACTPTASRRTRRACGAWCGQLIKKDRDLQAIVSADEGVDYGRVIRLVDLVKSLGVAKFALSTESKL